MNPTLNMHRFAIGAGSLVWGTVADRFGRRWTLYVSSVLFLGFTTGCVFSPTIGECCFIFLGKAQRGKTRLLAGCTAATLIALIRPKRMQHYLHQ